MRVVGTGFGCVCVCVQKLTRINTDLDRCCGTIPQQWCSSSCGGVWQDRFRSTCTMDTDIMATTSSSNAEPRCLSLCVQAFKLELPNPSHEDEGCTPVYLTGCVIMGRTEMEATVASEELFPQHNLEFVPSSLEKIQMDGPWRVVAA